MLRHFLPAWFPLLLLITFLGCQSLETQPQQTFEPERHLEVVNRCPNHTKLLATRNADAIVICGEEILKNKNQSVIKKVSLLKKLSKRKYQVTQSYQPFQTFEWTKHKNTLNEVLLINVNNRYKILNIDASNVLCKDNSCKEEVNKCYTQTKPHLFPSLPHRIKFRKSPNFHSQNNSIHILLEQLVWQSLNRDKQSEAILLHYKDWFKLDEHTEKKFEHYKTVVEKNLKSTCNNEQLLVNY